MPRGKVAAALVCFFVVVTTAGTWAAYSYAVPSIPLLLGSGAFERTSLGQPQTSNTDAKGDRLPIVVDATAGRYDAAVSEPKPVPAAYGLAAVSATAVEPSRLRVEPRKPAPEKTRRVEQQKLLLDDAQISALRTRLKLSPTQEEFWPAVEVTLRDVIRAHARKSRKSHPHGVAPQIDVNSPEVQQLISAAVPLIMRLSEEQKREVRQLARIIGLETVASRI